MPYIAMTAAEIRSCTSLPPKIGWMACHFSPYGTGLTNLPAALPPGALLILNDRTPVAGHDPERIFDQLAETADALKCDSVLLDFQRDSAEIPAIIDKILKLPCPVIVSENYAKDGDFPVFLPPVPLNQRIDEYIAPWQGREVWLDAALDGLQITVTERGSTYSPLPHLEKPDCPFREEALHCHYGITLSESEAVFTLQRTPDDLAELLAEAEKMGVTHSVGLYQELR